MPAEVRVAQTASVLAGTEVGVAPRTPAGLGDSKEEEPKRLLPQNQAAAGLEDVKGRRCSVS